ncbi:MAG: type II toxin-antitoxin system HicA family toxin, partial [Patescibacteria group bacterium]
SWKEFEKFLLFLGCKFKHQKGSHRIYTRKGLKRPLVIPAYGDIPIFIIRNNLRLLDVKIEEYLDILKKL